MSDLPDDDRTVASGGRILWLASLGLWTALALTDALDYYVSWRLDGTPHPFARALAVSFPGWMVWAALAPAAFWFAGRHPLRRPIRPRVVAAHLAFGIAVAVAHATIHTAARWTIGVVPTGTTLAAEYETTALDWAPISLLIYWTVVAVRSGVDAYRRFRAEELRAADLARRLADARFEALAAQLRPHFLFNTLNAAVALVRIHDNPAAARVLADLGGILRHLLEGASRPIIALREELAFLERYLDIERVRFGDRVAVSVDAPESLLAVPVPNLVLQPLVENAIRHGVSPHDRPIRIAILARADDGRLHLTVRDDGPGLPAGWSTASYGIGLENTDSRLRHLYGALGRLEVRPVTPSGVEAVVTLPLSAPTPET